MIKQGNHDAGLMGCQGIMDNTERTSFTSGDPWPAPDRKVVNTTPFHARQRTH